jgi:hypothetical protein
MVRTMTRGQRTGPDGLPGLGFVPAWWLKAERATFDTAQVGRAALLSKTPGIYAAAGRVVLFGPEGNEVFSGRVLIDTGAGVFALPASLAPQLAVIPDPAYRFGATLPDGRSLELHGALVPASIFGEPRELVPAYFHQAIEVPVLGLYPLLERFSITFDGTTKEFTWSALTRSAPLQLIDAPEG